MKAKVVVDAVVVRLCYWLANVCCEPNHTIISWKWNWSTYWEQNSKTLGKSEWKSGALVVRRTAFDCSCACQCQGVPLTLSWGISVHISQSKRQPCSGGWKPNVPEVSMRFRSRKDGGWVSASPPHRGCAPGAPLTMVQGHLIPYGSQCPACRGPCIPLWMCPTPPPRLSLAHQWSGWALLRAVYHSPQLLRILVKDCKTIAALVSLGFLWGVWL